MRKPRRGEDTRIQRLRIGNDDAMYLLMDLEKLYDISFELERTASIITAGELFDYLSELVGSDEDRRKVCLTAVSFYRLRGALKQMTDAKRVFAPDSDTEAVLERLSEGRKLRDVWRELEQRSGLVLPPLIYVGLRRRFPWLGAVLPPHCQTLAGLARQTAVWSHPDLAKEFGQNNRTDLWNVLCQHLIELSLESDSNGIGRETRLIT